MATVIDKLRMSQAVQKKGLKSNFITIIEYIQGWKNPKERTASVQGG